MPIASNIPRKPVNMRLNLEIPPAIRSEEVLTYRSSNFTISEMTFKVPLDYAGDHNDTITLFSRAVIHADKTIAETTSKDSALNRPQKPWLVYLEGGPGFGCGDPVPHPITSRLPIYRFLFVDYRGTGFSTTVSAETLRGKTDDEKAAYLRHFRQDNIIRDLEAIRKTLMANVPVTAMRTWSLFGQSFGGFVSMSYLSMFPESVREVYLTGGLAPVGESADIVYSATFDRATERNKAFYKKFPGDAAKVFKICKYIESMGGITLPSSSKLTVQSFLTMGISFGQHGGLDKIHRILTRASLDLDTFGYLTSPTLNNIETETNFDYNIIYAILHEAIYCDGPGSISNWAAQRIGSERESFTWLKNNSVSAFSESNPPFFSSEMIFPSHFKNNQGLRSLAGVAQKLAQADDWPHIYDQEKLAQNTVPIYAASYVDDLYVDNRLARKTAMKVGNCNVFETNAAYHNALRARPDMIIDALQQLRMTTLD